MQVVSGGRDSRKHQGVVDRKAADKRCIIKPIIPEALSHLGLLGDSKEHPSVSPSQGQGNWGVCTPASHLTLRDVFTGIDCLVCGQVPSHQQKNPEQRAAGNEVSSLQHTGECAQGMGRCQLWLLQLLCVFRITGSTGIVG